MSEEKAIVIWETGDEAEIGLNQAIALREEGLLRFACRRRGQAVYREKVDRVSKSLIALNWVKDRGVTGGRYGLPFSPNGNAAQMTLIRQ